MDLSFEFLFVLRNMISGRIAFNNPMLLNVYFSSRPAFGTIDNRNTVLMFCTDVVAIELRYILTTTELAGLLDLSKFKISKFNTHLLELIQTKGAEVTIYKHGLYNF